MQIEPVSVEKWQDFLEKLPDYSYFQSPNWSYIWEKVYPEYKVFTKFFSFKDETQVLVPIIKNDAKYKCKHLISLPYSTYGGFLWNKKPNKYQIEQILKYLLNKSVLSMEIYPNPVDWEAFQFLEEYGFNSNWAYTHILELSKDYEDMWENVFKTRSQTRKAIKLGVVITTANKLSDVYEYYQIYLDSARRWGLKKKP